MSLERSALFFDTACTGRSQLAASLGCQFNRRGGIRCGQYEATSLRKEVAGLTYVSQLEHLKTR
jgi:hypothetical protein